MRYIGSVIHFNPQGFEKGCGMRELFDDLWEIPRVPVDGHGFELSDSMGDDEVEGRGVGGKALASPHPRADGRER